MFGYNRFWHFIFRLDNRHYFRTVLAAVAIALTVSYFFFPFLLATNLSMFLTMLAPSLVVGAVFTGLNKLSDYFYSKQQETLRSLKKVIAADCKFKNPKKPTSEEIARKNQWLEDSLFNEQIDYYVDRREVCPSRLLAGQLLEISANVGPSKPQFKSPPTVTNSYTNVTLRARKGMMQRNQGYEATTEDNQQFFIKTAAAHHALAEVAANEMADITGFGQVIPAATLADHQPNLSSTVPATGTTVESFMRLYGVPCYERPSEICIAGSNLFPTSQVSLQHHVQDSLRRELSAESTRSIERLVLKFITLMQEIRYKIQMKKNPELQLLYIQKFVPEAQSGLQWMNAFLPANCLPQTIAEFDIPETSKNLLHNIDLASFQENFLTHIVLGSGDCNPGNTLFVSEPGNPGAPVKLYSIDHEDIMPEDNYNITKKLPLVPDKANPNDISIQTVENVFPMRIWLAGLPQADVPFSQEMMERTLETLDPQRLATYHRHKQLFSPKAVGAQLERVNLISALFAAELSKPEPNLTPKALFLKLINNHPTYAFLKKLMPNDLGVFMLLGFNSSDIEPNILLRPLQYIPMCKTIAEMAVNEKNGKTKTLSDEAIASPYGMRVAMYLQSIGNATLFKAAQESMKELEDTRTSLTIGQRG